MIIILMKTLILTRTLSKGPFAEEFVFRSCMFYLLSQVSGFTPRETVWTSAIVFGIAHSHHIIEHMIHDRNDLKNSLVRVAVQFSYTTVFALYCGHVFQRTQSLFASVLMHMYCNYLGLPNFGAIFEAHPLKQMLSIATIAGTAVFTMLMFAI